MSKQDKKRFRIVSAVLAAVTFFGAGAVGYIFTSPRIKKSEIKVADSLPDLPEDSETYFSKFTNKILDDIEKENKSFGINADINKFNVSYLGKDGLKNNTIKAHGNINVLINDLTDFSFTVDLDVNYNNKNVNFALGYVEDCFYFELQDIRLKSTIYDFNQIKDYVSEWFFDPENENGLGIPVDFGSLLSGLGGLINIDFGGTDIGSFEATEKEFDATTEMVSFEISNININLLIDKETLSLKNVDISANETNALNLDVKLDVNNIDKVLSFEDENYPKHHKKFTEVISYLSWCDNLVDLFNEKKQGLDLKTEVLDLNGEKICSINSKLDFNLDGFFDFKDINFNSPDTIKDKLDFDNINFNIGATLSGKEDNEYSNFNLAYFNKTAYLTLNEAKDKTAFMRAKCDTESTIEVINHLTDLLVELSGKDLDLSNILKNNNGELITTEIFDFITSSEVIKAIKNNDFSSFVDVIDSISHDENFIKFNLDLSQLNFGEKATIEFVINDKNKTDHHVIELIIKNFQIGSSLINIDLNTRDFSDEKIKYAQKYTNKFDDLAPLKGVVNQFSDILHSKSAKIDLSGKLTSISNKYDFYDLNGTTQFSFNEENIFGSIELVRSIARKKENTHAVDFEFNKELEDTLYVIYNNKLKGKIGIDSVLGIVDVIKPLLGENTDFSFDSFTSKIETSALIGAISNVLESKDYLAFTRPTFVKSITYKETENLIEIVVPKEAFNLNDELVLNINLTTNTDGTKELCSLSVKNLILGDRKLDLSFGVSRFDESYKSKIDKNDNSYLDFNSLKLLANLGINLIEKDYIYFTGNIGVSINAGFLGNFSLASIGIDAHILMKDSGIKVYFKLPNFVYGSKTIKCEFVYEQTPDGDLIHIVRNVNGSSESVYYRADLDFFIDHIVQYISVSLFDKVLLKDKTISSEEGGETHYEDIFNQNGFLYSLNNNVPTWNLNLNLSALISNDSFGPASVDLFGSTEDNGVINFVHLSTTLVGAVNITANLSLNNDCIDVDNWSNSVETRYNSIVSCANGSSVTKNIYGENDGYVVHL